MSFDKYQIILASASPRRYELLKSIISNFIVKITNLEEKSRFTAPYKKVMDIAKQKADAIAIQPGELLIAADTTVYLKGNYYEKPLNRQNALIMLKALSGETHAVYTGVCIKTTSKIVTFFEKSYVTFKKLKENELLKYIDDMRPYDKAGAYGIQDDTLVKSYKGSYTNIVGLPLEKLSVALKDF